MLKLLLLLLLLLVGSCSYFIEKIDTPLVAARIENKGPVVQTYCPIDQKPALQLVGSNQLSQESYGDLVPALGGTRLDFLDHFALWSLIQLSIRPDQSSPTSRFQVLFRLQGKTHYFDFFSEQPEGQYPYLYGIEWVLRKFGKKTTLESYAILLQAHLGKRLKVGQTFESFLLQNQEAIKADPELNTIYYRGSQILRENETIPVLPYSLILREYRKLERSQKIIINTFLTPFTTGKGQSGSCNYDFNLYDNSIFLIDKIIPVANLFGLASGNSAFMASSSQKIEKFRSLHGSLLFKGDSKVRSSAVCVIENEADRIWAFSNQSRDPGQHLFHLVRYGLPRSKNASEVDRLIRHSRHLFLSDPVRLVIESDRSREDQVENLLKLNLPIYNAEKLGNIWAYTSFEDKDRFIIDDRNIGAFLCR